MQASFNEEAFYNERSSSFFGAAFHLFLHQPHVFGNARILRGQAQRFAGGLRGAGILLQLVAGDGQKIPWQRAEGFRLGHIGARAVGNLQRPLAGIGHAGPVLPGIIHARQIQPRLAPRAP